MLTLRHQGLMAGCEFRAEKRTAQLSAHPKPYLQARVIMGFAMVERTADCNKVRENVVRLIYFIYLGKHDNVFSILLLRKQVCSYLLKGSLGYIFSGLQCVKWMQWMQCVKCVCDKKCAFAPKFRVYRGEI